MRPIVTALPAARRGLRTLVDCTVIAFTDHMSRQPSLDWQWAKRTGGNLTARQKRELLAPLLRVFLRYPAVRLRMATGRYGPGRLDLENLTWPDSALARDAETEARETLTPHVLQHSYRTYIFGRVLAQLDGVSVDEEIAFVASILHDTKLEHPTPGKCFAVVGGEDAERFAIDHGCDAPRAAAIGAAVGGHITPGVSDDLTDPAGFVSAGALLDITGIGLENLDPSWVAEVQSRHPRLGLRRHMLSAWKEECRNVPDGRAHWLNRYAAFPLLLRAAPYPD